MVHRKVKSKRLTTRHRAKVDKKVREHHRKLNKASGKSGHKKARKDPGVPSMFPGKEEFVARMQEERDKEKAQRRLMLERNDLQALAQEAATRAADHEEEASSEDEATPGKFYDSSKRAFYRDFQTVVDNADVILEVLDARDPLGCRVRAVEELVRASGGAKRVVLVLNKIDLVPREVVRDWLATLRRELPTVAFKASTQHQRAHLGGNSSDAGDGALAGSECLGGDTLIQLLKNYARSANLKTTVRVGVVGYPNVGKSSLINSLKRAKVCKVGATPGVTTAAQEVILDKNIKLLDCPGIVFANPASADRTELAELFLRNCVRVEQLEDPTAPIELIVQRASPEQLMFLYSIPKFSTASEFLQHIARRQGKLKKGGIPNAEAAARTVLTDWNQGKIPFYTLPPAAAPSATPAVSEAMLVTQWAPEFDLDGLATLEVDRVLAELPDALPAAQPIEISEPPKLVVAAPIKASKARPSVDAYKAELSQLEKMSNPQLNKDRLKALKQARKKSKAVSFAEDEQDGNQMDVDDSYDFKTDFRPQN